MFFGEVFFYCVVASSAFSRGVGRACRWGGQHVAVSPCAEEHGNGRGWIIDLTLLTAFLFLHFSNNSCSKRQSGMFPVSNQPYPEHVSPLDAYILCVLCVSVCCEVMCENVSGDASRLTCFMERRYACRMLPA